MALLSFFSLMDDLSPLSIIYWIIVIPASIIFLIQLALSFRNPDAKKNETNSQEKQYVAINFQLFRFRNIIGFFAALGWSGLACMDAGLSNESTILVSIICGIAMMFAMAAIFFFMRKLMDSVSEGLE